VLGSAIWDTVSALFRFTQLQLVHTDQSVYSWRTGLDLKRSARDCFFYT
jgi:hypothetical protein